MIETQIIILIVLLIFSGIFSGIETALMSISKIKVKSLLKQKKKGAETLYRIKQNPHKLIITLLIGNNVVNISSASLATVIFTDIFGSNGIGIATGIMTFLILIFGEIVPKTIATQNAEKISLLIAKPVEILSMMIYPLVKFFEIISRFIISFFGIKKEKLLSEEELKTIVTIGLEEGILNREAAKIHNVLKFKKTRVEEIMTLKLDIQMINGQKKLKDIMDLIVKTRFSKYPVYSKNKENIIGILDVEDVLENIKNKKLNILVKTLIKKPFFVPEFKKADSLLVDLEKKEIPLAIVVDEYGSILGLVTMEDVLEEIVGDIFDKSRRDSIYIKKINNKLIQVNSRASIEQINKILHLGIKEEHFNTLAGFIEHKLQRIPIKGEKIHLKEVTILIDKVTNKKINSVRIIKR